MICRASPRHWERQKFANQNRRHNQLHPAAGQHEGSTQRRSGCDVCSRVHRRERVGACLSVVSLEAPIALTNRPRALLLDYQLVLESLQMHIHLSLEASGQVRGTQQRGMRWGSATI